MTTAQRTITTDDVWTAALAYNADYPEAAQAMAAGTPTLRIIASAVGSGWTIRVNTYYGIRAECGWIGAGIDTTQDVRRVDGRRSPADVARMRLVRMIAEAEAAGIAVEVVGR